MRCEAPWLGGWRAVYSALILIGASLPASAGFSLAGTAWQTIGEQQGVDPLLLYAVALAESARSQGDGRVAPWPWTLNLGGKGRYFESMDDAVASLDQATTDNVDVGPMQINLRWHGKRVTHAAELLDTLTNLRVGAQVLREALASSPNDAVLGIGRYHSYTPARARSYGTRVMGIYQRLVALAGVAY